MATLVHSLLAMSLPLCEGAAFDSLRATLASHPKARLPRRAQGRGACRASALAAMVDGVSYRAVWVQCDRCKKWRQAPDWTIHPDESVPWFCEVRAPHTAAAPHACTTLAHARLSVGRHTVWLSRGEAIKCLSPVLTDLTGPPPPTPAPAEERRA